MKLSLHRNVGFFPAQINLVSLAQGE